MHADIWIIALGNVRQLRHDALLPSISVCVCMKIVMKIDIYPTLCIHCYYNNLQNVPHVLNALTLITSPVRSPPNRQMSRTFTLVKSSRAVKFLWLLSATDVPHIFITLHIWSFNWLLLCTRLGLITCAQN